MIKLELDWRRLDAIVASTRINYRVSAPDERGPGQRCMSARLLGLNEVSGICEGC